MSDYSCGLVSISFRKHTPKQILSAVKEAGLSCIEWGSDIHAPKDDREKLQEIAMLQRQYGIACSSYGTYFCLGETPMEELKGYIQAAAILGTDILRLWCGNKNSQEYSSTQRDYLFKESIQAAKIAEKTGVKLCMECHNGTFTNTKESALELMHAVNSNHFGMYWQPNSYTTEEENLQYAEALADYTEHIHVFNWCGDERLTLKDGVDIWAKYLEKFKSHRTLLLEFMPDDRMQSLTTEAQALRKIAEAGK